MPRFILRSSRFGVALSALALLAQAALLPLLHTEHEGTLALERAKAFAVAASDGTTALTTRDHAAASTHDVASCPVCATIGRTGAAIAPATTTAAALPVFAGLYHAAAQAVAPAPDLTRGAPRGPPALVS